MAMKQRRPIRVSTHLLVGFFASLAGAFLGMVATMFFFLILMWSGGNKVANNMRSLESHFGFEPTGVVLQDYWFRPAGMDSEH